MRAASCLALVLLGTSFSHAQDGAPITITASPTVGSQQPWVVGNVSALTATAVVLACTLPAGGRANATQRLVQIYDAATEPLAAKPILPSRQAAVPLTSPCAATPAPQAAVFADGTSWGDPAWVSRILQRRQSMGKYLHAAVDDLTAALAQGATRDQVITTLQSAASIEAASATRPGERAILDSVRGLAIRNLQRAVTRSGIPIPVSEQVKVQLEDLRSRLTALALYGGVQ